MQVKLWGTRGSLPRTISQEYFFTMLDELAAEAKKANISKVDDFIKATKEGKFGSPVCHGGNTSCTEISSGNDFIFVDSGSGIATAGDKAMARGAKRFHIFQTHFHWDHIMGLPFFVPMYIPGMEICIYHVHKTGEEDLRIQYNGRNFPVPWDKIGGTITFKQLKLYEKCKVGALEVTPFALDHPGGSFGYRVEADGRSFAVGVDGEFKRFSQEDLGKDLPFYQDLDGFIFDGQYEMDELVSRYDWGHCTPTIGVDLAVREGIRNLIFTHHDPRRTDAKSREMFEGAKKYLESQMAANKEQWESWGQPQGPNLYNAYDGMIINMDAKGVTVE